MVESVMNLTMAVDLSKVEPLNKKHIVAFVNHFLMRNVELLNSFVSNAETRIIELEKRMSRVEVDLKLLEVRIDSISGLPLITSSKEESSVPTKTSENLVPNKNRMKNETKVAGMNSKFMTDADKIEVADSKESSGDAKHCFHVRDDPRYAVYFKMLRMGVPECAVKQKMVSEGVDPTLLQTPDAVTDVPQNMPTVEQEVEDDHNSTSSLSDD
ncbi:unnamed protein product [Thelazia callipaeda]|uniref:Coiled-coil domain-containing protein 53 n=1 Tax=Thelazia callipaeda TaxID=103827 RepID=A0A0N5D889_THECL|nr:unnamed protein product [Thelazia callipaeda]